jgi:recombination protein RecA
MAKKIKEPVIGTTGTSVTRAQDILRKLDAASSKHDYGKVLLMGGVGDNSIKRISSGILSLDIILGGGYPCGRIVEISGENSSGKTTCMLHAIEASQRGGGVGVYIDSEFALSVDHARSIGVDVDNLLVYQPDCGEQGFEVVKEVLNHLSAGDIVVVDSVAAMIPKKMLDGDMGDTTVGSLAKMMSESLNKIKGEISKSGVIMLFTNQMRSKIGMYGGGQDTAGGNALKFYSSCRVSLSSFGKIKGSTGDDPIGQNVKFKTIKNKTYPPFKEIESQIIFGKGFYKPYDVASLAVALNVAKGSTSWIVYKDVKYHGRANFVEALENNPDLLTEIEQEILQLYCIDSTPVVEGVTELVAEGCSNSLEGCREF